MNLPTETSPRQTLPNVQRLDISKVDLSEPQVLRPLLTLLHQALPLLLLNRLPFLLQILRLVILTQILDAAAYAVDPSPDFLLGLLDYVSETIGILCVAVHFASKYCKSRIGMRFQSRLATEAVFKHQ